jgi:tyrosyl-tRNA synthetase
MAKDSVKKRLETGLSFTEFSYQLIQGYDFYWLYKNKNCKIQMGGSDQWGNIVTGTEFIRRKENGEAFALTSPLVERSDGKKFGKSEEGNIWLDANKTSPYKLYQYWLNVSDEDAEKFMKIFTLLPKEEIYSFIEEHKKNPDQRMLQKKLAGEITTLVHSSDEMRTAVDASTILFGKGTTETLKKLDENTFLSVFEGVPLFEIDHSVFSGSVTITDLLVEKSAVFSSKGELRRLVQGGGLNINKEKVDNPDAIITSDYLLNNKYLLIQKGKKNYFLLKRI